MYCLFGRGFESLQLHKNNPNHDKQRVLMVRIFHNYQISIPKLKSYPIENGKNWYVWFIYRKAIL